VLQKEGADAARIAEHWLGAGAAEQALPLLLEAAAAAKEAMCYHEAAQRFEKAAAVQASAEDHAAEFATLLDLFDCLVDLDRHAQIDTVLARLDRLAGNVTLRARALEARARALLVRLQLDAALAAGGQALELAAAAKDADVVFDARLVMMQILAKLGRLEEAEALLIAARPFAEGEASTQQRVYFFEAAAFLATQNERFDEGRLLWQKLEASAVEMKSPRTVATALNYQTLCEGNVGAFESAAATAERWRAYVIDSGLFGEARQFLDLNLAYVYQNLGRYGDALAAIERAEALKVAHLGGLHVRYASAYAVLGQFARVRQHLDAITEATPMTPGLRLTAMMLRLRMAQVAGIRAGPGQGVDAVLAQAERVAVDSHKASPRVRWLLARAEFLDPADAVRAARDAAALAQAKGLHGSRISAEVLLARALLRQGEAGAALPRVRIALGLAASFQPDVVYYAEVGQVAHQVLSANGENGAAVLRDTVDWIQETTARHVPAEFRDSFMHRNPVNRDLLAAASRLGSSRGLLR
jgi:tetratricopeptide (TPR) repeat protein